MIEIIISIAVFVILFLIFVSGFRVIRPLERGLVERFGKYNRFAKSGLNYIIPFVEQIYIVNITEQMVDAEPQEIITKDKLNAMVDAQVYFKVKDTERDVMNSIYNVQNYKYQIVNLARTTLRNIIGTMTLNNANSDRNSINSELMKTLESETKNWGIAVVRTELKEINPPKLVQETMNNVVIAENEKQSAIDFATATETRADGERRAKIKQAEGEKAYSVLIAEGQAKAFEMINKSFTGNAQKLKSLEVVENSLKNNAKIILPEGKSLVNVIGSLSDMKGGKDD
jgi:regulator of protease activity HflC (stomatin/prohibitin superfamily)